MDRLLHDDRIMATLLAIALGIVVGLIARVLI